MFRVNDENENELNFKTLLTGELHLQLIEMQPDHWNLRMDGKWKAMAFRFNAVSVFIAVTRWPLNSQRELCLCLYKHVIRDMILETQSECSHSTHSKAERHMLCISEEWNYHNHKNSKHKQELRREW